MSDLDDQIRDALQAEQDGLTDDEDWLAHYESMKALFRGQQRWLTIYQFALIGFLSLMAVVSAIQFFRVESTRAMIAWATVFTVCCIAGGISNLWFYMEWNKCVARRDAKQLELQIAALASGLRTEEGQGDR